ncbi:MAG: MoaD/ThiS family protein [Candidatus Helarchaeota archaeon]
MTNNKIKIEFSVFATLRNILGFKTKLIEISPGITIVQFLKFVRDNLPNGQSFYNAVFDKKNQQIKPYMRFIIDGHIVLKHEINTYQIPADCKTIAVFPPVGGGFI